MNPDLKHLHISKIAIAIPVPTQLQIKQETKDSHN